jgi:hypothetical protein
VDHPNIVTLIRMRSHSKRLFATQIILLLLIVLSPTPKVHASHVSAAAYTVSGTVFDDYNQNGTQDNTSSIVEPGINGVVVTAYNAAGTAIISATSSTVSSSLGQYSLAIPAGTGPVRVQFSNFGATSTIPQLVGFQPSNHKGGTSVAFVDGTQTTNTVNLGIERPSEYCQNNPAMATTCYIQGGQTEAGAHVVVRFPYNSTGKETTNPPTPLADDTDVGATWGLSYRRSSDDLFVAAYTKLLAGYKPGGSTGAIYLIHGANSSAPTVNPSPFIDLNTLFGATTAGANPHTATNNYVPDLSAYDAVGKTALGGLALSEDETTLYAMNLADRSLYSIPIGAPPAAPVAPNAGNITVTPVPTPADCITASDMRPFAVTVYENLVYVGAVCSAESTITSSLPKGDASQLKAYVFAYTPGTGFNSTPVFEMPLNYTRHCADGSFINPVTCMTNSSALWRPWQPLSTKTYPSTIYPQPMFTSMTFDNGDLIIGLRDRYGDQTGHLISGVPEARTAGDDLRACLNTPGDLSSGWTLENNGTCGSITIAAGQNNGKGSGNGQYYYTQYFQPYHDYTGMGGVFQVPGFPGVIRVGYDPGTTAFAGGVRTYSNTAGNTINNYEIYNSNQVPETYGKSNGLGDLVAFCQSAPIEIGNRVWYDSNGNGIQDAGEAGIAGVTVHLYTADGTTLLQTTTTDSSGAYYFTISSYTSYVIKLDNAADYASGGALQTLRLTSANQDSSNHLIDSKATLPTPTSPIGTGNYPSIFVSAHTPGQNDDAFDVGLVAPPDLSITKTVALSTGSLARSAILSISSIPEDSNRYRMQFAKIIAY